MKKTKSKRPFKIQEKQVAAAKIFAVGDYFSLQEVADRVGVSRVTLWRWWQRREFRQYCERIRRREVGKILREMRKEFREEKKRLAAFEKRWAKETEQRKKQDFIRWVKKQDMPAAAKAEAIKNIEK